MPTPIATNPKVVGKMFGFKMKINDKPVAWRDYTRIVIREGTVANVHLPEHFLPTVYGDELLGFDYSYANVKSHGCRYSPEEIVEEWIRLEGQGVPLDKATQAMVVAEIFHFVRGFTPIVSPWISLIELVDLTKSCRKVQGFKCKFNRLKKNLSGIVEGLDLGKDDPSSYLEHVNKLYTAVASWVSELTVIRELLRLNYDIKLPSRGYDIKIEGFKAGRVEVKSRMEPVIGELARQYEKGLEEKPSEPMNVTPASLVMMVCWTASRYLERAIEQQDAQILFVDISRSFSGFLMLASSSVLNIELPFDKAVNEAIELAKSGKVAIVIYAQSASSIHNILGWTFEKENLENMGTTVDKIKADLAKTGKRVSSKDLTKFLGEI